jgi:hypothetical protein
MRLTRLPHPTLGGHNVLSKGSGAGFKITFGPVTWYDYVGDVQLASGDGTGQGSNRGWAYEDTKTSVITGQNEGDEDPTLVITIWTNSGGCTPGWEVIINGVQMCNANATLH